MGFGKKTQKIRHYTITLKLHFGIQTLQLTFYEGEKPGEIGEGVPVEWRHVGRENGRDIEEGHLQRGTLHRIHNCDDDIALSRLCYKHSSSSFTITANTLV